LNVTVPLMTDSPDQTVLASQDVKPVIRIAANGYWDSYNDL